MIVFLAGTHNSCPTCSNSKHITCIGGTSPYITVHSNTIPDFACDVFGFVCLYMSNGISEICRKTDLDKMHVVEVVRLINTLSLTEMEIFEKI